MSQPVYVPEEHRSPHLEFPAADGRVLRKASCVIRWEYDPDSTTGRSRPYVYANATHPAPGVVAVWVDQVSGRLVVKGDRAFGPTLGGRFHVDETLAANGFGVMGPSIGPEIHLQLTRYGNPYRADAPELAQAPLTPYGNVWVGAESLDPAPTPVTP